MVIRAGEPIIIDTGMVTHRVHWFEDVFSLVQPQEVRWIYITHIDTDHAGNLVEALERCPNAQLVTSHGESFRTSASLGIPLQRMRMVNDGETFEAGDRLLRAVRPPVYDSPYTRGLFDACTSVYYAADAFCAPMPEKPVDRVDQIPPQLWADGMARFHHASLCPWITMVDQTRFEVEIARFAQLDIKVIVGAHTPIIDGSSVSIAFQHLAGLPSTIHRQRDGIAS
jgi:flavorubredoxin